MFSDDFLYDVLVFSSQYIRIGHKPIHDGLQIVLGHSKQMFETLIPMLCLFQPDHTEAYMTKFINLRYTRRKPIDARMMQYMKRDIIEYRVVGYNQIGREFLKWTIFCDFEVMAEWILKRDPTLKHTDMTDHKQHILYYNSQYVFNFLLKGTIKQEFQQRYYTHGIYNIASYRRQNESFSPLIIAMYNQCKDEKIQLTLIQSFEQMHIPFKHVAHALKEVDFFSGHMTNALYALSRYKWKDIRSSVTRIAPEFAKYAEINDIIHNAYTYKSFDILWSLLHYKTDPQMREFISCHVSGITNMFTKMCNYTTFRTLPAHQKDMLKHIAYELIIKDDDLFRNIRVKRKLRAWLNLNNKNEPLSMVELFGFMTYQHQPHIAKKSNVVDAEVISTDDSESESSSDSDSDSDSTKKKKKSKKPAKKPRKKSAKK